MFNLRTIATLKNRHMTLVKKLLMWCVALFAAFSSANAQQAGPCVSDVSTVADTKYGNLWATPSEHVTAWSWHSCSTTLVCRQR